jgi:hypothetical protein
MTLSRLGNFGGVKRPTSPFSCLVEEILRLDDRQLQRSFLNTIWFERLIFWKISTFARPVYIKRIILPMTANTILHLVLSVLSGSSGQWTMKIFLATLQGLISIYLAIQKVRQYMRTSLFFESVFNSIDVIAILFSTTMSMHFLLGQTPSRPFIAYSMPVLWLDLILTSMIFEKSGVLMMLLKEMMKGVLPFLILLGLFIVGKHLSLL